MAVKIFADGADIEQMIEAARNPLIKGFTTNPSLMKKAGVKNYVSFAERVINTFPKYPISLEVFSDDITEMEAQARKIAAWGDNVFVKIPITNTHGVSCCPLISRLVADGIRVNATAILCYAQIDEVFEALGTSPAIISVFAGRIADTGRNPEPFISHALKKKKFTYQEVLWASPRQVLDVYTADSLGCDVITLSPDLIKKLDLEGKSLTEYSRETVTMFFNDAKQSGYRL